jgi:hypothetical protein
MDKWYSMAENQVEVARTLFGGGYLAGLICAQKASCMGNGGNQYSAWCAYLSFFHRVVELGLPEYEKWQHYEQAAIHSGPRVMHENFCIISDRPETLLVDNQNRPHCDTGPFCKWRDGSALYAVHGVRVPAWVIETREKITVDSIAEEDNAEVRRVMISRYGEGRYLIDSGAKEISRDKTGTLYRKEIQNDEPLVMVRVENSTPEKDGTAKSYFLRVPPDIQTAKDAVAWTFGVDADEYTPEIET